MLNSNYSYFCGYSCWMVGDVGWRGSCVGAMVGRAAREKVTLSTARAAAPKSALHTSVDDLLDEFLFYCNGNREPSRFGSPV